MRLFRTPLAQIHNREVDAMPYLDAVEQAAVQRLLGSPDVAEAVRGLEEFLLALVERLPAVEDRFLNALARVRAQRDRWDKEAMNDALFVSDRQMQRMFKSYLGVSPKTYFKIMRFREAYDTTIAARDVDWLDLSCTLGYSDQAHFIRDFKRYTGLTPGAFQRTGTSTYSFAARS